MRIEDLDHPFLFIFAVTLAVFAMAKLIAYVALKSHMPVVAEFFAPGSSANGASQ